MIDDYDEELPYVFEKQINMLAALLYQSNGRRFAPDIDFKNSTHPEERACWNQSIIAHSFINKDSDLLRFQVK